MTLEEYIRLPHRWRWGGMGGDDCTTFCAGWVVEATGKDPAADLRGTYFDAAGAEAVLRAAGGVESLAGAKLMALGFRRVTEPQDGDIGIIRALTGFDADGLAVKDIPGIKFGPLWAVMSARGPMVKKLDWTGVAWRIA
ncbi:conserved hypothetical protein [Mesorhizobium ventifaucium]|uniref:DUF6950 domain-containing protein n=2 Tax=Mesorhizobium ventifaucium TaxID=666020 RepID=A0ABM9DRG9_9HYPH|nr:hypothetical protein [Mesorhizobium ventifaucium]CAH2399246.1 conserved hypothetical protein [Mesorhizobium ventifaucium]